MFLNDLKSLPKEIFEEFVRGNFTIKKSNRKFSSIGIDQAHEQNNKIVKIDGGAIGILDDERALLEWAVAGPCIAEMISESSQSATSISVSHHEDTDTFEKNFRKDCALLLEAYRKFGSPFEDPVGGLMNIVSRQIFPQDVAQSVMRAEAIGRQQSVAFMQERVTKSSESPKSLYSIIHKNNLKLFRSKNLVATSKTKLQSLTMKERIKLYANLYVGCQSRQGNLDDFFRHENHDFPPSLSEYGRIKKPTMKSDVVKCLPSIDEVVEMGEASIDIYRVPKVDAVILDGPALVQMNTPKISSTFGDYCEVELGDKIRSLAEAVQRVDVVFDVYRDDSRKRETRESRGKGDGVRISVKKNTPIYHKFNQILAVDDNKTELNYLIADTLVRVCHDIDTTVVVTKAENVISIVSVDSDVIVIALYAIGTDWHLDVKELWVEFGCGKDRRWHPIHYYAKALGEEICMALPFWYAFTGCDSLTVLGAC